MPATISVTEAARREQAARAEAKLLEELASAGEAVAAEPAKELLRSVGAHHSAEDEPSDEESRTERNGIGCRCFEELSCLHDCVPLK